IYSAWQSDTDIWLGTLYGLFVYRNRDFLSFGTVSPVLADRINSIGQINDLLVIGTATYGLAFISDDSLLMTLSEEDGLRDNTITSLYTENDSILWAGTKNGLHKVNVSGFPAKPSIESYGPGDGLPSGEINAIGMHDGHIWLATSIGLVSFDPKRVKPFLVPPIVKISSVQINGADSNIHQSYQLKPGHNDLHIEFQSISFRKSSAIKFRYKMEGLVDGFVETVNNYADFPNLPAGKYTFSLAVSNIHNQWNELPTKLEFEIGKPLIQTTGFLIFLILSSLAILISLSLFLQRQRKIKAEARTELARMEQRIFRLQMNPHFVFNALLAIQGFMYQRNVHDAGRYLTSFAKLIRHTLYGSSEELMPLDMEIEAMQYYLDLQRLRFNNNFEYSIELGEGIYPETMKIPPLLIQPFLENAIEHGLQHKTNGKGELKLKFYRDDQGTVIEISDNGIGRERSAKMQKKKGRLHKSLGMNIVNKRITSLNKIMGNNIKLKVIDLNEKAHGSDGTIVRIYIPGQ
ncbi:MAG TPA: histidine kinase, partial [Bacteroidales bacterium]|nr:histidine kinase [Bacteroidales bacterium]